MENEINDLVSLGREIIKYAEETSLRGWTNICGKISCYRSIEGDYHTAVEFGRMQISYFDIPRIETSQDLLKHNAINTLLQNSKNEWREFVESKMEEARLQAEIDKKNKIKYLEEQLKELQK